MSKCISCSFCGATAPGMGICYHIKMNKNTPMDTLKDRECKHYKLGPMHSVWSRPGYKS